MRNKIILLSLSLLFCACSVPEGARESGEEAKIFPDYKGVVIPPNISPLDFKILNDGERYVTTISGEKAGTITVRGRDVKLPSKEWKALVEANKGSDIVYTVNVKRKGEWLKLAQFKGTVVEDPIDDYMVYRLLAPSYEFYTAFSIRQRNLSTGEDREVYNNRMHYNPKEQQCMNCHQFQNYRTENWQMHVRQVLGGTLIVTGDESRKVNLKTDSTMSAGVYPAWHPTEKLIAYSVNRTRQFFHEKNIQKLEVQDPLSDLILYDIDKNEVSKVAADPLAFETFPAWSPDGKTLYYSSARQPEIATLPSDSIAICFDQIRYDLMRKSFDPSTKSFGPEELVYDAKSQDLSAMEARISPDGRFLLFSLGGYGTFHIWHRDSDLWVMDLESGESRSLTEANSNDADSFHNWSSNGRWIVFTSRRDDGLFSRVYFSYFDREGNAHKPFMLPMNDLSGHKDEVYSYNVPEFCVEPIRQSVKDLSRMIEQDAKQAEFK
ncbi:MAG: PD40 domain-containing protein [Bacteroidales bacterium]|nr:PD40 domain-containing protein [Bacteroidales bacterium]MBQ6185125.1 PD40 domain-containing protein [Bacteroidales bacterium]